VDLSSVKGGGIDRAGWALKVSLGAGSSQKHLFRSSVVFIKNFVGPPFSFIS